MNHLLQSVAISAIIGLWTTVSAHMEMTFPPPLKSKANPFAAGDVDFDMTSPLSPSGSDFPCKGYLSLLGSEAAKPVANYQAGQTYNMTIGGGANHNGGSCQASLSFDGGKTFTVIKSYVGGCPASGTSSYDFTVPNDVPSADDAIFAWTWFNQIGNREMYMNCAVVSTEGGGSSKRQSSTVFSSRPTILVANVGNGCSTSEGTDVQFPNPGPDVAEESSGTSPPQGSCGGGNGADNGDLGPGDGAPPTTTTPVAEPPAPTPEQPDTQPTTSTLPGGVFLPMPSKEAPAPSSTLRTVTNPPAETTTPAAGGVDTNPESTASPALPTGSTQPTQPTPGGDVSGAQAPGTPCDNEGGWNCVAGKQFQRCASGTWSALMAMAAGTTCESGFSQTLIWVKKRGGARRMLAH